MFDQESGSASGGEPSYDFEMPTAREIELDLALGSPSWQGLMAGCETPAARSAGVESALGDTAASHKAAERLR